MQIIRVEGKICLERGRMLPRAGNVDVTLGSQITGAACLTSSSLLVEC